MTRPRHSQDPAPAVLTGDVDPDQLVDEQPAPAKPRRGRPRKAATARKAPAPRTGEAPNPAPKGTGGRPSNLSKAIDGIALGYQGVGKLLGPIAPMTSLVLQENAGELAASWQTWAETNPKVRAWLERIAQGSGAGVVLMAHLALVSAVMADAAMMRAQREMRAAAAAGDPAAQAAWDQLQAEAAAAMNPNGSAASE